MATLLVKIDKEWVKEPLPIKVNGGLKARLRSCPKGSLVLLVGEGSERDDVREAVVKALGDGVELAVQYPRCSGKREENPRRANQDVASFELLTGEMKGALVKVEDLDLVGEQEEDDEW